MAENFLAVSGLDSWCVLVFHCQAETHKCNRVMSGVNDTGAFPIRTSENAHWHRPSVSWAAAYITEKIAVLKGGFAHCSPRGWVKGGGQISHTVWWAVQL